MEMCQRCVRTNPCVSSMSNGSVFLAQCSQDSTSITTMTAGTSLAEVGKTAPSSAKGAGLIPGWGPKIPYAAQQGLPPHKKVTSFEGYH